MSYRKIKDIVIVGGGSAGWSTALYARSVMPDKNITLIESDSIGILGAGEGTTPDIIRLTDQIQIPLSQILKETGSTIKNAIKFVNWNGGGRSDYFFHGFFGFGNLNYSEYQIGELTSVAPLPFLASVARNESFSESDFFSKLSELNRLPFIENKDYKLSEGEDPIMKYINVGNFSLQTDAAKLAKLLRSVAESRNIVRVEGVVKDFTQKEDGDVDSIILESGRSVNCDFVFDCSGFNRLFHKRFRTEWVSHKDVLPVDSALPFFLPTYEEEDLPPYTQAVALKNGWMWKTPLQHRYGCGYVFDSNYISFDEAKQEVEAHLGHEVDPPRTFSFEAGYYKTPWVHNVISIGLSSAFIEPLEATAMWTANTSLGRIFSNQEVLYTTDSRAAEDFNKTFVRMNEEITAFIYYHYMTDRSDTEFWSKFNYDAAPDSLKEVLSLFEIRTPSREDFLTNHWPVDSWYRVGLAHNNPIVKRSLMRAIRHTPYMDEIVNRYEIYKQVQDSASLSCVKHRSFIEDLMK